MFKAPLSATQIDKISLETVERIQDESVFFGETLQIPRDRLKQILASTDTVGQLRRKYLDYRMGDGVTPDELKGLVAQMKDDIGAKQGDHLAQMVVDSIDGEIATALKETRGV